VSDLIPAMAPYQFNLDTLRFVHIRRHEPAKLALVCARKEIRQNCRVEPPLYIYSSNNTFTGEYTDFMK
jgi:tRNA1(Val) A37 N6-methylase TrmN6